MGEDVKMQYTCGDENKGFSSWTNETLDFFENKSVVEMAENNNCTVIFLNEVEE